MNTKICTNCPSDFSVYRTTKSFHLCCDQCCHLVQDDSPQWSWHAHSSRTCHFRTWQYHFYRNGIGQIYPQKQQGDAPGACLESFKGYSKNPTLSQNLQLNFFYTCIWSPCLHFCQRCKDSSTLLRFHTLYRNRMLSQTVHHRIRTCDIMRCFHPSLSRPAECLRYNPREIVLITS